LQKENLDGWLVSIENRSHVEVAIINDPSIFELISFEPLRKNWRNGNCLGVIPECKNWGTLYPISSRSIPVVFHLNEKYRRLIEEYALQVILENSYIQYIKNI
jgi:hypothetical protein